MINISSGLVEEDSTRNARENPNHTTYRIFGSSVSKDGKVPFLAEVFWTLAAGFR